MRANFFQILAAILLLLAVQADASLWFRVVDITPIQMLPDSEANFTVSVKGLGSERAYVNLVFRNVSEGLSIACPSMIKNVFPQGVTEYDCTVAAGDIEPGNYSFVADVVVGGAPSGKMTGYVDIIEERVDMGAGDREAIEPEEATEPEEAIEAPRDTDTSEDAGALPAQPNESQKEASAPGAVAAALAIFLILWRTKR